MRTAPVDASRRTSRLSARADLHDLHPAATARQRATGAAACVWMILFAAFHAYWALGGTYGLPPGESLVDNKPLFIIDLIAIPMNLGGAALALALRPAAGGAPLAGASLPLRRAARDERASEKRWTRHEPRSGQRFERKRLSTFAVFAGSLGWV